MWIRYRSGGSGETERALTPTPSSRAMPSGTPWVLPLREQDACSGWTGSSRWRRSIGLSISPGFDTPQVVLDALADIREDRWSVEVLLETTLAEARGQLPKMGVSLEETQEGVIMRSSTSDLAWMSRVLAGLSFPFVVRGPSELREALRHLAAEIVALAERTDASLEGVRKDGPLGAVNGSGFRQTGLRSVSGPSRSATTILASHHRHISRKAGTHDAATLPAKPET